MRPNQFPSLDFGLGETADLLRDTVMSFAAEEIAPLAAEIDRSDRFPRALWPKMGALGLLGLTVEEDHGGAGMGYLEHRSEEHTAELQSLMRISCAVLCLQKKK